MGQINKIPLGYLNMLGAQTGGKNPFNASEILAPTQEMTPFYHAQNMRTIQASGVAVQGGSRTVTVPADEVWFIYHIQNFWTTAIAADEIRFQNAISFPNSPSTGHTIHATDDPLSATAAAASMVGDGVLFPQPLPVTQGTTITQIYRYVNGAGNNAILQVLAAIFKG